MHTITTASSAHLLCPLTPDITIHIALSTSVSSLISSWTDHGQCVLASKPDGLRMTLLLSSWGDDTMHICCSCASSVGSRV